MLLNSQRFQDIAKREKLDALIASTPENVTYSSGYWALSQWIRRGPQTYVILFPDDLEGSQIVAASSLLDLLADQDIWIRNIQRFGYFQTDQSKTLVTALDQRQAELYNAPALDTSLDALCKVIKENKLEHARIGLDELGLYPGAWDKLQDRFPKLDLVRASDLFSEMRAIKTDDEVGRLCRAANVAETSIQAALKVAKKGVTETEMSRAFHHATVEADTLPVLCCIGFGLRSAMPNVQPSLARLNEGEIIRFDVGGRYKHYRADIARTAVLGEASEKIRTYNHALLCGVRRGMEVIRPGLKAARLYQEMMEAVRRNGLPHYRRSHVGHGIGIDGYDLPHLTPDSTAILEEGMVMCIETPYYELGFGGLQVEDTVRVTADGVESFMTTSGELKII